MKRKILKTLLSLFITVLFTQINYAQTVTIGKQVWMTKNLNVDKFRNGGPIPEAKTEEEWKAAEKNKQPAWCYYDYNPTYGEKYGKLYNWYAVNDLRGLAPEGWKIPSDKDWTSLTDFLGGESVSGKKMKSTEFWAVNKGESGNGTNESSFLGLPGSFCVGGSFVNMENLNANIGKCGYWWTSTELSPDAALYRKLDYSNGSVLRNSSYKENGFSVRCLKD
jgi:uncharacterized protein (TIGR02145 family)